ALVAYGRYVLHALWPAGLAPMYPRPVHGLPNWQIALAGVLVAAVTALAFLKRKRQPYLLVGWLWFLGTLVPMIGLVQVGEQAMADRYAYLPYLGLFLMICWGIADLARRRNLQPKWLAGWAAVVLIGLVAVTSRQIGYWSNNVTLWTHTLQVTGSNFVAEDNLGGALLAEGRTEDAIGHFRKAAEINPSDPMSHLNVAAYEQQHGQVQQAIASYQEILRTTSDPVLQAMSYANLGSAYRMLHEYQSAKENYQAAVDRMPANAAAWIGLGLLEQKSGDLRGAIGDYSRAARFQPTDVAFLLLAQALQKAGRGDDAQSAFSEARRWSANLEQAQQRANELLAQ
ncbi:MAG TPA: tetratricopeptide repeat protein, partial [Terriglobales bacterium]|nr:tetratricopeptide repeat protein [Terriglobales bacterium]